jgi:hypothetical protein
MANILHVCGWFDPSGDVARSVSELDKHSEHEHDVLVKWQHPLKDQLGFPEPLFGQSRDNGYVNERFAWADAIIYHLVGWNCPIGYNLRTLKPCAFRNANVMFNKSTSKFYCLQEFFANPMDSQYAMLASCHMGARDFMGDRAAFLPALMPIWNEAYMPDWSERRFSIGYIKHGDEITRCLLDHPMNVSTPMAGWPHKDVMRTRRGKVSITIDNVGEGHYGLAGTESLSQGIPSIAWNHPTTIAQLQDIAPTGGNPFIQAEDVRTAVKHALAWPHNTAQEYGRVCRDWIETYYDSRYLIERYWEPFCDKLASS